MAAPLLHLTTPEAWRAALTAGAIAPSAAPFVHLSTPGQVALPANRLFAGRGDLLLLVLDPDRIGVEVRVEAGDPPDPQGRLFPHAYGPVPTAAAIAVLPYRPGPDGVFAAPRRLPDPADLAARAAVAESSLVRRVATSEVPVTGGVAVRTAPVPASHRHDQLLLDGPASADDVERDAARTLPGPRRARLDGTGARALATELGRRGWSVEQLVLMAAPATGAVPSAVQRVELEELRPFRDAARRRDLPGIPDPAVAPLTDRHLLEAAVVDLRPLAIREGATVVAACLLRVDGATAVLDALECAPAARGRGLGTALVAAARALAGGSGCDVVTLQADAADRPRHWCRRLGFTEVGTAFSVSRG